MRYPLLVKLVGGKFSHIISVSIFCEGSGTVGVIFIGVVVLYSVAGGRGVLTVSEDIQDVAMITTTEEKRMFFTFTC
jgi:hypothetical protein